MADNIQISNQTRSLYTQLGFRDLNGDGRITGDEPGYEGRFDPDGDGISPREAWNEYCSHIDEYPHVKIEHFKNPFETDQDLVDFTHEVIEGSGSEVETAQRLFFSITPVDKIKDDPGFESYEGKKKDMPYDNDPKKRVQGGYANASEAFDNGYAQCSEYSFLYTAMAREAGLNASVVHVNVNNNGRPVNHLCVLVTLSDGREVLVDPAYGEFDIKHMEYSALDDAGALASHYYNSGNALLDSGNEAVAFQYMLAAIECRPDFASAHYQLARIYYGREDFGSAISHLCSAIEFAPESMMLHRLLTDYCARADNFGPAIELYERLLESEPGNELYLRRLERNRREAGVL